MEDNDNNHRDDKDSQIRHLLSLSRQSTPELLAASPPYEAITKLDLPNCGLSELPIGFERAFPQLSILFLSGNCFAELPAVMGQCPHLQMVAFKDNGMTTIHPDALQAQLRWLILTHNQLTELPDALGTQCPKLQKCMLSGNRLTHLPQSMKDCQNLELIRLASNQLTEYPLPLLQHCPQLAWIALSDNPCSSNSNDRDIPALPVLNDLVVSEDDVILGRGAGGVTRKVQYQDQWVAVKEYGDAQMTSDGLPAMERRVACAAAALPADALVPVLGQVRDTGALVLEYLDGYVPLAQPPSLESCSRDVYPADTTVRLTEGQAEVLISHLLQALAALHAAGICHGDFYGHNILVHPSTKAVRLTDWGAAFFYDKTAAPWIQLTEIRAFATLTQEVQTHCLESSSPLLTQLVEHLQTGIATANNAGEDATDMISFESILVWWKQKQLATMAQSFDPDAAAN